MFILPGYIIQQKLLTSRRSSIYRGIQLSTNKNTIIKTPAEALDSKQVYQFEREFEYGRRINSEYIVRYLDLKKDRQILAIILEDDSASEISKFLPKGGFELNEFLPIAIKLIIGLHDIHKNNLMHGNINLSNIIFQPETGIVKYIDFRNAAYLNQKNQSIYTPYDHELRLNYISPEQTGRVNRSVDYRADYYSLGCVFYALLCGQLPFIEQDLRAIIYSHIAKMPIPLHVRKSSIPEALSNIIIKLLAKEPEDRYQSCQGLLNDIENCQKQLLLTSSIALFDLAQEDQTEGLLISEKLYGREKEIEQLRYLFQSACKDSSEMLMVTGDVGSGKTTLVKDLKKIAALSQNYFVSGKFDQLNFRIAYSGISQAFRTLINQILKEPESILAEWKSRLQTTLGSNAQLLIDFIPELELLLGKQPAVQIVGASEAENRFNMLFLNFIRAFCHPTQCLILFLDDLQWADYGSLNILKLLASSSDIQGLFLIAAYRHNELNPDSPVLIVLDEIRKSRTIHTLELKLLDKNCVNQWVAETLGCPVAAIEALSEIIYRKTQGNPFFIKIYLQSLYEKGLLKYELKSGWQWDTEKIRYHQADTDILAFLSHRIEQLPKEAFDILSKASCLGNRFHVEVLKLTLEKPLDEILRVLEPAFMAEIIIQREEELAFAHDRMQEICYSKLSPKERAKAHLSIGQKMLQNEKALSFQEHLFDIVDHFNKAEALISEHDDRLKLAGLNLNAGRKAKHAIAYHSALGYFSAAINYLVGIEDTWGRYYFLTFNIFSELAETTSILGDDEQSKYYLKELLTHAKTTAEKAETYNIQVINKILHSQYQEAVEIALQALSLLGITFPSYDQEVPVADILDKMKKKLEDKTPEMLLNAGEVKNPEIIIAMKLLYNIIRPASLVKEKLLIFINTTMLNLTLEYGNTKQSPLAYITYAILIRKSNINLAYKYSQLAIDLSNKLGDLSSICYAHTTYAGHMHHWKKPLIEVYPFIIRALEAGVMAGEFQHLGYAVMAKATADYYTAKPLPELQTELIHTLQLSYVSNNQMVKDTINAIQLALSNLLGQTSNSAIFEFANKNDEEYIKQWLGNKSGPALCIYRSLKAQALYLHGNFEQALEVIQAIAIPKASSEAIYGYYSIGLQNFIHSLILLKLYPAVEKELQLKYWQQLELNQIQLKQWAETCPENFMAKYCVVAAEMTRLNQQYWEAIELYEQARQQSKDNLAEDYAIVCELTGDFWLERENPLCAKSYLMEAYRYYEQWGAKRKLQILQQDYPRFIKPILDQTLGSLEFSKDILLTPAELASIDITNIVKSSELVFSEIELDKLLKNILQLIVHTAGAQKAALILPDQKEHLIITAEYKADGSILTGQGFSPLEAWEDGSHMAVEYVHRVKKTLVLGNALMDRNFGLDPYVQAAKIKSLLCMSLLLHGNIKAILYGENNLIANAFTDRQILPLVVLSSIMAISIENIQHIQTEFNALQRIAEEQQKRANEEEQHRKIQSAFIDMVCHEVCNPMTGISGSAEELKQNLDKIKSLFFERPDVMQAIKYQEFESAINAILDCVQHQKNIINSALDLSRIEAGKIAINNKYFSPKSLINSIVSMLHNQCEQKQLVMNLNLPEQELLVFSDENHFNTLLTNLITNAIAFNSQGTITINLNYLHTTISSTEMAISIEDTGEPLGPEKQAALFERFSKAQMKTGTQYEGVGFAFSIVKQLIELLGGKLSIDSQRTQGKKFILTLPCQYILQKEKLHTSSKLQRVADSSQTDIRDKTAKKILIIEDNFINQKILRKMLENGGCQCEVANDGQQGLACWREAVDKDIPFDLVFMDIEMPVMNGLEATQQIRQQESILKIPRTPIVCVTGYASDEYRINAEQSGADDFFTKPYTKERIYEAVTKYTEKSEAEKISKPESTLAKNGIFGCAKNYSNIPAQTQTGSFRLSKD